MQINTCRTDRWRHKPSLWLFCPKGAPYLLLPALLCHLLLRHPQMVSVMETTQLFCVSVLLSFSTLSHFKAYPTLSCSASSKTQTWLYQSSGTKSSVVLTYPHPLKCHGKYFPKWSQPTSAVHRALHRYSQAICSQYATPFRAHRISQEPHRPEETVT